MYHLIHLAHKLFKLAFNYCFIRSITNTASVVVFKKVRIKKSSVCMSSYTNRPAFFQKNRTKNIALRGYKGWAMLLFYEYGTKNSSARLQL